MRVTHNRPERIAGLIQREISQIILRQINDPRLKTITVNRVKVSPDLRVATIFVSNIVVDEDSEKTLRGLGKARKFIRGELGHHLRLRYTPEIVFKWDDSVAYSFHIADVISDLKKTGTAPAGDEEEE